jgi:hypothetical protein
MSEGIGSCAAKTTRLANIPFPSPDCPQNPSACYANGSSLLSDYLVDTKKPADITFLMFPDNPNANHILYSLPSKMGMKGKQSLEVVP